MVTEKGLTYRSRQRMIGRRSAERVARMLSWRTRASESASETARRRAGVWAVTGIQADPTKNAHNTTIQGSIRPFNNRNRVNG